MARRFIVKEENIKKNKDNQIIISGEEVKHIQVLRKNIGDEIIINSGIYKIIQMKRDSILLEYIDDAPEVGIPISNITLYIALLKTDKLDFVVQKAVEIGVKKIVPFSSANVVVKLDDKAKSKRVEKLQKVADEACKQCGRTDMVAVEKIITFKEMKAKLENEKAVLFAYEASKDSLRKELNLIKEKNVEDISLIIGAEGGFTQTEAEELKQNPAVKCVSLGTRILRAETAALNLLSIVIYEMEE